MDEQILSSCVIEKERFLSWLEELRRSFKLIGPVNRTGAPGTGAPGTGAPATGAAGIGASAFASVQSVQEVTLDYGLTMLGPQTFIYHPEEKICTIQNKGGDFEIETMKTVSPQILLGVHSCDLHAILVLDKALLKKGAEDRNYRLWRENTVVIGLHCLRVYPQCFCASMGTGPLFEPKEGYDFLLTDLGDRYLVETLGERALKLISPLQPRQATEEDFEKKIETGLESQFQKNIDTTNLPQIILRNQGHPVWKQTADQRCLGCTNCTQVCPTCFCYNLKDNISFDLNLCERTRYKDSCQELHFAEVHGENFRSTRTARLRQFVTHKLATWVEQFGCFGCVGCGRCMTWCPTKIDLTEMAGEIMETEEKYAGGRRHNG